MTIQEAINLAMQRQSAGNLREAESIYRQILNQNPNCADAWHLLGLLANQTGNTQAAVDLIRRAVAVEPGRPEFRGNLGSALASLNRLDEALEHLELAAAIQTGWAQAHHSVGVVHRRKGDLDKAIAWYAQSLMLEPNQADVLNNLGEAECLKGDYDNAIVACRRALAIQPNFFHAHLNLATSLAGKGDLPQAIAEFQIAIKLRPSEPAAHAGLGAALLLQGEFEQAWPEFEWRLPRQRQAAALKLTGPAWNGGDLAGKRILLYAESDLGSAMQFARYIPMVEARGAKPIVAAPYALRSPLESVAAGIRFVSPDEAAPSHDTHCALMSLPLAFKTTLQTIPAPARYISPSTNAVAQWQEKLAAYPGRKIGLAWADAAAEKRSSFVAANFQPLTATAGVHFFSVQIGTPPAEFPQAELNGLTELPALVDLSAAAALIDALDLVITIDSPIAHLAGAMGKPVWVILPRVADWRWLLNRNDSPWYPSMRLFRQTTAGDWQEPIAQIAKELTIAGP